ncbi:hypothetical protein ACTMU2_21660 [Cupriavidus basilensis]
MHFVKTDPVIHAGLKKSAEIERIGPITATAIIGAIGDASCVMCRTRHRHIAGGDRTA